MRSLRKAPSQATTRTRRPRCLAHTLLVFASFSLLVLACSSALAGIQPLTPGSSAGQITNENGGCLDLPNGDTTDGNLLHIWQCDSNGLNQTWYVDGAGSIHYAVNPLKCVDFPSQHLDSSGNPIDETQLQIWDCNGATGPDQVWKFSSAGQIEFANDTAKCVELRDGSSANNTPVQIFDCNGTSGQTWSLFHSGLLPAQGFQLQNGNEACLDLTLGNTANGTLLQLWQCDSTGLHQTWYMDGLGSTHYAADPTKCIDFPAQDWTTSGAGFVPKSQLQLWSCNGGVGPDQVMEMLSNHTLQVSQKPCVEARSGSSANGTAVQAFGCNGTTGQTWFPHVVGNTCRGTMASNGTCNACGGAGEAPCAGPQIGCNSGLVSANVYSGTPMGSITKQQCVTACGAVGQLPCTDGPMGYNTGLGSAVGQAQVGQSLGGCTEQDAVILWNSKSNLCQWPITCGQNGQSCCDAGSAGQTPSATTDLCHMTEVGSCTYVLFEGWQCQSLACTTNNGPC
jgi:hypothetical protein